MGWPLENAHEGPYKGNGNALRMIYEKYLEYKYIHDYAIYMDGADSFIVRAFEIPKDKIVYSAEKACWPVASIAFEYDKPKITKSGVPSPWRFLNAGTVSGPIPLLIEFFEKYGINKYADRDVTGQLELHKAYLQALKDGFPIELDEQCEYYQTTAFEEPGYFDVVHSPVPVIVNKVTMTTPHVFHGNGRTNMDWIYNLYK